MHVAQVGVGDVRINLRCVNRSVAEELLDGAKVSPVVEKVGREDVAEYVRSDFLGNASLDRAPTLDFYIL